MEEKIRPPRETERQQFDPALLARELASFRDMLAEPISKKRLDLWIEENEERKYIAEGTLWGTIRWPKRFGLPHTPILASAFIIEHRLLQAEPTADQVSPITFNPRIPTDPPQKWDGPHDEHYYRVSFMSYMMRGHRSEFIADFAERTWMYEGPLARFVHRSISPASISIAHAKDHKAIALRPFTVINTRSFR